MHRNTIRTLSAFLLIFAILFSGFSKMNVQAEDAAQAEDTETTEDTEVTTEVTEETEETEEAKDRKDADAEAQETDELDFAIDSLKLRNSHDPKDGLSLSYPEWIRPQIGGAEGLKLDKMPERIINLSTSTLDLMALLDVKPIAVSRTVKTTSFPEYYEDAEIIDSGMNTLDIESVLALEPDLVILGLYRYEDFHHIFEERDIPVYYTGEGPLMHYEESKVESLNLAEGFGGDEAREDLENYFTTLEAEMKDFQEKYDDLSGAILFGMESEFISGSESYVGSLLAELGFENVADESDAPTSLAPTSVEIVTQLNPQIILLTAPPMGYEPKVLKASFDKMVSENADVWTHIDAVANDKVLALSGNYTTNDGIRVLENLDHLMDQLAELVTDEGV